jgi:2-methylcitrate dehydratase PrpD
MMNISLKRWPSGSGLQTTVSALFDLIAEHDVRPDDIAQVRIAIPAEAYKAHGTMAWDDKFKAMLSARFLTSVILHDRNCWTEQFEDARRLDPDVDRFAQEKVEILADDSLTSSAARTEIELSDGSVLTDFREAPKGDPTDPLDLTDVVAKYGDATDESTFTETIEQLTNLATVPDIAPLIRRLGV